MKASKVTLKLSMFLGLICATPLFADGAAVAGVAVGGIGVNPNAQALYQGQVYTSDRRFSHLNGNYYVSSDRIQIGQSGYGMLSFVDRFGSQTSFTLNCQRAFDSVGTKVCVENSSYNLKYVTTNNPQSNVVSLSIFDTATGLSSVIGYIYKTN